MEGWNPNLFLKEGRKKGFNEDYLQRLVDHGRSIQTANAPVIFSLAHLANVSRTLYSDLHSIVARNSLHTPNYPYKNFPIRKRSGGKRWISIPVPELMAVQLWIAQNILRKVVPHNATFAYVANKSNPLRNHAQQHCGAEWILKIDIKNFFSNISEQQVFHVFRNLKYSDLLSFEMARLCTRVTPGRIGKRWNMQGRGYGIHDYHCPFIGSLPQGAPTSPALSNLVCTQLDEDLTQLAMKNKASYSRYADDLCFSFATGTRNDVFQFKKQVSTALRNYGFTENNKKTRIIPPGARKIVTGLVLNDATPKIPREMRDKIRMHLYYAKQFGIAGHCERKGFRSIIGFRNHLHGLIRYVISINPEQGRRFEKEFQELPWLRYNI